MYVYVNIYQLNRHLGKHVHFFPCFFFGGGLWCFVIHGYPGDVCLQGRAFNVRRAQGSVGRYASFKDTRTGCKGKCWENKFIRLPKNSEGSVFVEFSFVKLVASFIFMSWALEELRHFDRYFPETWNLKKLRLPPNGPAKSSMLGLLRLFGMGKTGRGKTPEFQGYVSIKIRWIKWSTWANNYTFYIVQWLLFDKMKMNMLSRSALFKLSTYLVLVQAEADVNLIYQTKARCQEIQPNIRIISNFASIQKYLAKFMK